MKINNLTTEKRNANTTMIDQMSALEFVQTMNNEDLNVIKAIKEVESEIAELIEQISNAFDNNGRLIYIGAGTSGRLGVLDAVECVPTFGVIDTMVIGLIAGGEKAFMKAVEGAEDSKELAIQDLKSINLTQNDIVIGLAASGRTPYVIGGLEYATSIGANTGSVTCNKNSEISKYAKYNIEVEPGPEVLTGSTRLKAGSAQKMVLNMLSTGSMIKQGKVYQNLMVDVQATNEKLVIRSENIIMDATGVDRDIAKVTLLQANKSVKTAITMILNNCDYETAMKILEKSKGFIKEEK